MVLVLVYWHWYWCCGCEQPCDFYRRFRVKMQPICRRSEGHHCSDCTVGRQRLPFSKCSSDKQWPGAASDIKAQRSSAATVRSGTSGGHAKIKSG